MQALAALRDVAGTGQRLVLHGEINPGLEAEDLADSWHEVLIAHVLLREAQDLTAAAPAPHSK